MSTRSEKRAKKIARRKPTKTNRVAPKAVKAPRTKRDTAAVLAHEARASSPEARAARTETKTRRVRGKARG
jgi:hypothetical protein